ncbi:SFT2-domain-containing protein [Atractiella rhizophila]|nr:SFT2-domain-containing protein [Atractiella rhizophila]
MVYCRRNIDTNSLKNTSELFENNNSSTFDFLELSKTQRIYGFVGCVAAGFAISIVGGILFTTGNVTSFALLYTIGVLVSLVGTGFLIGFKRQLELMFKPVRLIATIVFISSIVLVFISAYVIGSDALVLVFAVTTYLAYIWYSLSYIPFARDLVKRMAGAIF